MAWRAKKLAKLSHKFRRGTFSLVFPLKTALWPADRSGAGIFFCKVGDIFCKVGWVFWKVGWIFFDVVIFLLKVVAGPGF